MLCEPRGGYNHLHSIFSNCALCYFSRSTLPSPPRRAWLWQLCILYLSISISRSFLSIRFYQGKSRAHSTSVVVPSPLLHHVVQQAPDGFSVATPHIFSRCARFSLFWSLDSKAEPCRSVVNTFPFITPFLRDVRHSDFVKICLIVSSSSTWDKTAQWRCLHASESC